MTMKTASKLTAATRVVAKRIAKRGMHGLICAAVAGMMVGRAQADNGTWSVSAGAATHNWTDTNMWASVTIADGADSTANFTGIDITGAKTVSLNGTDRTIGNIMFTDLTTASHDLTISGNILTLDRTDATPPQIDVTQSGRTLTISSLISGSDGLQKIGAGTLILSGSNNFTGGLELNAGTLQGQVVGTGLAPVSPLGAGAVTLNGGTLQLRASGTLNTTAETITFGNNVTVGGNTAINVDRPGATSTKKTIQLGTLSIGANTLTVTGGNTYGLRFGATTASGVATFTNNNAGTPSDSYGLTLGSLTLDNSITTGTTTTISVGGTGSTFIGAITDNSVDSTKKLALSKSGSGTLYLTAAGNYTGGTTVSAGTILVSNNSGFGAGIITVTENSSIGAAYGAFSQVATPLHVNATKTLTIPGSSQYYGITFTGVVSGSGTISVVGGNDANTRETFGMTNAGNTFTGDLVNGGGSAIINVNSLGDAGKITLGANNVTGGFQLGTGTATSLLFNTRQIVLAGSSALYNNNATPSTTFTVNTTLAFSGTGVRTLTLGGSNTGANTFGGIIGNNGANAVSLIKESASKWILTGANTYSGNTTISGGTLEIGGSGSLGSSGTYAATISNAGTLRFNSSANQTLGGAISGAGALIQDGTGILTLTAANTYSGSMTVNAGTLSLGTSNSILPDASTLSVGSSALLNLNYTGSDTVLYFNLSGAPAAAGEWGATDSDAANKSPLITGTGRINNLGGDQSIFNIGYWDGGTTNILANGNLASDGRSGNWNSTVMNWDYGPVAHKVWANTTLSSAVFGGTAGTVTLGEPVSIKNLTINTANYIITGSTLNFTSGNITAPVVATISSAITGSPAVTASLASNTKLTFAPTAGSVTLGAINGPNGPEVVLAGSTTGNTFTSSSVAKLRVSSGTWTASGAITAYEHFVDGGKLIVNNNMTSESRALHFTSGTLEVNGILRNGHASYPFEWSGTSRLQGNCTFQNAGSQTLTVPATGTLAPGKPTGTFTNANAVTINGKLAVTINGAQCSKLAVGNTLTISSATLDVNVMSNPSSAVTIATYTTLSPSSGPFATVTGLPSGWTIDYQANGGKAITLTPPPAGTMISFF